MLVTAILLLITGLALLIFSSDKLIQGSVKLSLLFRVTPLFLGSVLIAFGTSTPEAGIGIVAALRDYRGIALGNIIGSNICNIGLILGLCALLNPLRVDKKIFKREMPIMIGVVILFYVVSIDLVISRLEGLLFLFGFFGFCILSYKGAKKSFDYKEVENFKLPKYLDNLNSHLAVLFIVFLSLLGVIAGADLMVRGGVKLANFLGIKPWIIGITILAVGSSLPELFASLTAASKNLHSISIGNIIGSNVFNILFILGIVAILRPIDIDPTVLRFELPVLIVFSFSLFTLMLTGYRITRWEGLGLFLGYITFLIIVISRNI